MKALSVAVAILALFVGASPASAQWTSASHIMDGACSIGSRNSDGTIVSVMLDADGSQSMIFGIPFERGNWFVINVGEEWSQAFQNASSDHVSVGLNQGFEAAFREGATLKLYKRNAGFVGSPYSLRGSAIAYDELLLCHRDNRSSYREPVFAQVLRQMPNRNSVEDRSRTTVPEPVQTECAGFYAYAPEDIESDVAFSVEVQGKAVEVLFTDYSNLFGRAQVQEDGSVMFNEGRGDPMWRIRCHGDSATLEIPADEYVPQRTFELVRSNTDIWGIAEQRGWQLGE